MAKRSRLAARPGQRRPLQRTPTRTSVTRPATSVTPEEEARAAELEAQILADEKAADDVRTARARGRRASTEAAETTTYNPAVPLSVREAAEYRYVQRDVRRIVIVGGFLLLILAILEVLVNGMHLFTL